MDATGALLCGERPALGWPVESSGSEMLSQTRSSLREENRKVALLSRVMAEHAASQGISVVEGKDSVVCCNDSSEWFETSISCVGVGSID